MPSKKKPKKTQPSSSRLSVVGSIRPTSEPSLSFSFKYFQADHDKFSIAGRSDSYLRVLLDRFKAISGLTAPELLRNRSSALRCHPIRWSDTTENGFGIPYEDQLVDCPYQFSLSSNEHGRVHGFFIGAVFYVVWLDPNHELYA